MPRKPLFNNLDKFKIGTQVLYHSNEYFVSDIKANQVFSLKLKRRFQPYRYGTQSVRPSEVVINTEAFRKNLQAGTWITYDARTCSIPAIVVKRDVDTVNIQPLHVRDIITVSIFSNQITKLRNNESYENYQLRPCCLTNKYVQALASYRGSTGYIFDYEGIADRYMFIRRNDMNIFWLKKSEMTIREINKDPFFGNWKVLGSMNIPLKTLFSELKSSYSEKSLPDPLSLKLDLWFFLSNSNIRCKRTDHKNIDILISLFWMEYHWAYWKREFRPYFLEYDFELHQHQSDTKLLQSVSEECMPYIADRLNRTVSQRRRASKIESYIKSRSIFKTTFSYDDDNLRVTVRVPEAASLRTKNENKAFIFEFVCRVLDHFSTIPKIVNPDGGKTLVPLKLPLKSFQEKIVFDMIQREKNPKHVFEIKTNLGLSYNAISGFEECSKFYGGILAIDTGYGKTICTLALITHKRVKRNLVVVPLSLMDQWITEIHKFTNLSVSELYNNKREVKDTDITITTYGTLASLWRERRDVFNKFNRVVFDESHTIKTYDSNIANACCEVNAKYKWCLTATPFRKGALKNIETQLKMLNIKPFHGHCSLFRFIHPEYKHPRTSFVVQSITNLILKPDVKVELPTTKDIVRAFHLNKDEQTLYNVLHAKIKGKIEELYQRDTQNYMKIRSLINKLCICASDPFLLPLWEYGEPCQSGSVSINELEDRLDSSQYHQNFKQSLGNLCETSCTLCLETIDRPTITPCLHIFCNGCINKAIEYKPLCPMCRQPIHKESLEEIKPKMDEKTVNGDVFVHNSLGRKVKVSASVASTFKNKRENTRVEYLKSIIASRKKVVVFSQFNTVLKYYASLFDSCIITGKSTRTQRKMNLERFKTGECKLFFLSTNVANVGLNLEEGDTLVFIDPGLDPTTEEQAIGRLLRIGQRNHVEIHRFYTENTIADNVKTLRLRYNFQQGTQAEKKASFLTYAYRIVQ